MWRDNVLASCLVAAAALFGASSTVPLEAAFQGQCSEGNPCEHRCFNIRVDMFECECREGFVLHSDGYSCHTLNDTRSLKVQQPQQQKATSQHQTKNVGKSDPSMSVHIEVDIDPPPRGPNDPTDEQLMKLGLPTGHVHFSTDEEPQQEEQDLLRPDDLSIVTYKPMKDVDYQGDDPNAYQANPRGSSYPDRVERLHQKYLESQHRSDEGGFEEGSVDPPRALPIKEAEQNKQEEDEYRDMIYNIDAFCNLDCGAEGECFMEREEGEENVVRKRCLCPHGKYGEKCALDRLISSPEFSGRSYLALPTLTNAYSDLQLSMEFRVRSTPVGSRSMVLLLTGESSDMTGDYLALLVRDGHVELRLDCGTGPGVVRTRDRVRPDGAWNRLTVFRHDWGVWMQLNDGPREEGRSRGLFSRITFAQPVLLGGVGNFRNTGHFLQVGEMISVDDSNDLINVDEGDDVGGFEGCIRRLEINNKIYNFEPAERGGDALFGVDIGECPEDSCSSVPCLHGGVCVDRSYDNNNNNDQGSRCQCPLGFSGEFCQHHIDITIPRFNGTSHLTYFGAASPSLLTNDIQITFKAASAEPGLILYNDDGDGADGDFIAVYIDENLRVVFAFDCGDGQGYVRSSNKILPDVWTTAHVTRTGRLAILTVTNDKNKDDFDVNSSESEGAFDEISLAGGNLYLGGVPGFASVNLGVEVRDNFRGCVQKLVLDSVPRHLLSSAIAGADVDSCAHPCSPPAGHPSPCGDQGGECHPLNDDYTCVCPLGLAGVTCEKTVEINTDANGDEDRRSIPSFGGDGYLVFDNEHMAKNILGSRNSLSLRLKLISADGLVLWTGGDSITAAADYLLLAVKDGLLHFAFNLGNGEGRLVYNATRVDDGKWHRIKATRTEQTASLKVDNGHIITGASPGKLRQLNGNGRIYIGGVEDPSQLPLPQYRQSMVGCVSDLSLGSMYNVDLMATADAGANVEDCRNAFK